MELGNLIFNEKFIKPYRNEKKGKIIYIIRINKSNAIDANDILFIQKNLNYINRFENSQNNKKIELKLDIEAFYFGDKTVILILEMLLFALLQNIDLKIYTNIRMHEKQNVVYNYFKLSYLYTINRRFVTSLDYCMNYANFQGSGYQFDEKKIIGVHFRQYFSVDNLKKSDINQQILSSDISFTLNAMLNDKKILNEICLIVDELIDNIVCHTQGIGLVDIGIVNAKSHKDDGTYYQFMINVLNISENCLYTRIKNMFKNTNDLLKNRSIIEKAYQKHVNFFSNEKYSEDLFFMVSAFQNGITTRSVDRLGGTGLSKAIINFSKRSQDDLPDNLSYVYSGENILIFNNEVLKDGEIGNYIAFNKENDYYSIPDEKCLSKTVFFLNGTAYNLMFIVKEKKNEYEQNHA
ncbi:MAG: hypothetical protein ACLRHD_03800 [Thomasclavelia spiroformis]